MKPICAVENVPHGGDDRGHPQAQSIDAADQSEVEGGVGQGALVLQACQEIVVAGAGLDGQFLVHGGGKPFALLRGEPLGVPRTVGHKDGGEQAQQDGRDAFDDVQPLPPLETHDAVHLQEQAGDRSAEGVGHRLRQDEDAEHRDTLRGGEPQRQVEQDGREEPCLCRTQQEPDDVVGGLTVHHAHGRREDAPCDEDPGQPLAGAEPVHAGVAGDLQERVAEEENTGAQAIGGGVQADVLTHGEFGEAHVVAVKVGNEVEQDDQGHNAAADLAERTLAKLAESGGL